MTTVHSPSGPTIAHSLTSHCHKAFWVSSHTSCRRTSRLQVSLLGWATLAYFSPSLSLRTLMTPLEKHFARRVACSPLTGWVRVISGSSLYEAVAKYNYKNNGSWSWYSYEIILANWGELGMVPSYSFHTKQPHIYFLKNNSVLWAISRTIQSSPVLASSWL